MQTYPVRPSHRANLRPETLAEIAKASFGTSSVQGDGVEASYGALDRLRATAVERELGIETTMNPKVSDELARETIRRYNEFLEAATGYSAKERAKRLRKSASRE